MKLGDALGKCRGLANTALEKGKELGACALQRTKELKDVALLEGRDISERAMDEANREFLHVELREDLSADEKISRIIGISARICKGIMEQRLPVPPCVLVVVHAYMATRLAAVRGVALSLDNCAGITREHGKVIGTELVWGQVRGSLEKLAPLICSASVARRAFVSTYGIGRVMDASMVALREGQQISREAILAAWRAGKEEGNGAFDRA